MALSVLVLPAPFGPSKPKISPADLEADRVDCHLCAVGDRQLAHLEDPAAISNGDGRGSGVFGRHRLVGAGDWRGREQQRSVLVLLGDDVRECLPAPQQLHPLRHRRPGYASASTLTAAWRF